MQRGPPTPCHGGTKAREVRFRTPASGRPSRSGRARRPPDPLLTGAWRRTLLVRPDGSTDVTSSVTWLQAGAYYVDLRRPAGVPRPAPAAVTELPAADLLALAAVEGFAGRLRADGRWTCWDRTVDLQPPAAISDEGLLVPQGADLVETGRHERYVEHWARCSGPDEDFCAAELRDADTGAPAVLLRIGEDVGWARGRPAPLPPAGTLADLVAAGDPAAVAAAFDVEVALGTVTPDGGVVLTASSLPSRAGTPLDLTVDGDGLRGPGTLPDGTAVLRRWRVRATEGSAALLPVHPARREVRSARRTPTSTTPGRALVLTQNLYEGLLSYKLGADTPEIVGNLATDWTVSPDNTVYTLDLRDDVTFHDGTKFDSSAVEPSFDRRLAVGQGPSYMVADVKSVETPSPTQVVITLNAPNSAFLDYLAAPYGPKMMSPAILSQQAGDDNAESYLQTHDAGTGPYTLTKADVGQGYEMKAYDGWWGGDPYFTTVELPVTTDLSTQQLMLNNGELHGILHDLNAPAVEDYLGNDGVATHSLPSFTTEQVYVNPNTGLLADPAARKAFQQALDVETLREQVFKGRSEAATGNYPAEILPEGTDKQDITPDTGPLAEIAKSASAEEKSIVLGYDTSQPDDQQLANLVSAKLQGPGLTPKEQGYTTWQVFGWIGNQDGAPSVLFSSFWPDAADPYTAAHILYAPDGGLNYLGCSDPQITELLPGALQTGDDATYAQIGKLASATGCWTNIAYRKDFMVTQTWLKGVAESHDIAAPMSLHIAGLSA